MLNKYIKFHLLNIEINISLSYFYIFIIAFISILSIPKEFKLVFFLSFIIFYTFTILIHELGHAFFIKFYKYKINKIVLTAAGGECHFDDIIEYRKEALIVALGGLIFQLILFIISAVTVFIINSITNLNLAIYYSFISVFLIINPIIFIYNLIPTYSNDGKIIFENLSFYKRTKANNKKPNIKSHKIFKKIMKDIKKQNRHST